jgi:crossover junction endodeoxyribonuclease RuvC
MMRPLRLVALDLSLTATGIAVTHDQAGQPRLSCRTVSPRRRPTETVIDHQRLHETFQAVAAALACLPDLVVIEFLPSVTGTGGVPLRLAELHGALKHFMWAKGHRYKDVEPQHLKTYATGNGNAKKELVRAEATARYGGRLHIGSTDEADAVTLLALALDGYGQPLTDRDGAPIVVPPKNRAAVGKVAWPVLEDGGR